MDIAPKKSHKSTTQRVIFDSIGKPHDSTTPTKTKTILSSWLIQLARYWSIDRIEVCYKQLSEIDNAKFVSIELKQSTNKRLVEQVQNLFSQDAESHTIASKPLMDLHHYCIICPNDAIVADQHLLQTWQHPESELQLLICGDANVFPNLTIERLKSHFEEVYLQLSDPKELQLDQVECLPSAERTTLLEDWNKTERDYPIDLRVDQLFAQQALKTPNNLAIRFKNEPISYHQLSIKINQFAEFLIEQGVTPGAVVGLCLTRSPLWPIGMLAIWKVGAIFLPLEAELPDERLSYILADSDCGLVVTEESLASRFGESSAKVATISLSQLEKLKENVNCSDTPVDTLAYVIYTSGTTGLPKGVKVNHRGLSNLAYCQFERMSFEPNQRILQAVSFNFDASLHDVTFALLSGSTLCIADENERLPGPAMVEFLRNEKVNFITLPPSALETLPFEDLPELHTILAVGEVCSSNLVNRWAGIKKFFNGYGPTETTVGALIGECFSNESKPTIGTALANVKIYILDHRMKPVPIGVIGEIYVGGVGVAQGYMNKPERTEKTFVSNPFSQTPNSRLYKTGDKARFLEDGRVDFIGRIDDQVKIAGRRIEIEEIEARCKSFEEIKNAAVVVHQDETGNKLLRAFILIEDAKLAHQKVSALRQYLSKYLPSYMLPVQYFILKEFPASINGKLDRKRLEKIESDSQQTMSAIKIELELQNIQLVFKGIGHNIYLPICYYGNPDNTVSKQKIADKLDSELASFAQPFTLFSLGHLPKIDSLEAIEQLPTPTEYENRWQNLKSRPSTDTQKILEAIWLKELNTNEVFLDDNFVDCGGDSLKAVKIILQVKNKTGIELSGADIFGSDFGYCSARLESELTGKPMELISNEPVDIPETVQAIHYQSGQHQLYGVYHPTLPKYQPKRAVLICSGLTNDYQRARPMLQKLAARLCSAGYPCMRFDYFGCGDSQGHSEAITLAELQTNIVSSIEQLKQLSGCSEVVLFGVRLAANIIASADHDNSVKQIIMFDPMQSGADFLIKQRQIHSAILNDTNYFQWRKKARTFDHYEEILGQSFSHEFLREIENLALESNNLSKLAQLDIILSDEQLDFLSAANIDSALDNVNQWRIADNCGWQATDKIDTTIIAKNLFPQVLECLQGESL